MTATENLQSSTRPAPSAETVIAVRGLTKVFTDCSPGVVNLNSQVDSVRARGARPSGRFSVRQRWGGRIFSSLRPVKRRERRVPYATRIECQPGDSEINPR